MHPQHHDETIQNSIWRCPLISMGQVSHQKNNRQIIGLPDIIHLLEQI